MHNKNYINERRAHVEICLESLPKVLLKLINQYVYEIKGESNILTKGYHINWVSSFSDNDCQIVFNDYGNIHIFDLESNKICMTLDNQWRMNKCGLCCTEEYRVGISNKMVVFADYAGQICVWRPNENKSEWLKYEPEENCPKGIANVVEFQGTIICGFSDGEIKIWNLLNSEWEYAINFNDDLIAMDILFDGRIVCASYTKVKIWNNKTKQYELTIDYAQLRIYKYVIALGNLIAICPEHKKSIIIHDSVTGQKICSFPYETMYSPPPMAALPNGKIVCGCKNAIKIWDPYTEICEQILDLSSNESIVYIKVIHDGRIISYSTKNNDYSFDDHVMRIWS